MLLRQDDAGVLAIGQPSHAWLSGQLARAWGNERFGPVEPWEEVCLAAEQHDVGWDARDLEPLFDAETGRPRPFMGMPLDVHLGLFVDGPRRMLSQSRYAALLISMHGHRLYSRRDPARMPAADAAAVREFLAGQEAFQAELASALRSDPLSAPSATDPLLERNSLLVWTWDYLSLALCLGWGPVTAKACPTASGEPVDLELTPGEQPRQARLGPWPFSADRVSLRCEGRRLGSGSADEASLRAAFERAPWETLQLDLVPG
jgi:hypothetical protein